MLLILSIIVHMNNRLALSQYCSSPQSSQLQISAFNIGRGVYLCENKQHIWKFNLDNYTIIPEQTLKLEPRQIVTALSFNFVICNDISWFCKIANKARNLAIVVNKPENNMYTIYRINPVDSAIINFADDNDLQLEGTNIWGLHKQYTLTDSFWIPPKASLEYHSLVFVPQISKLYASIMIYGFDVTYLMSRALESSGEWARDWIEVKQSVVYYGMFLIGERVFGLNSHDIIYEFLWHDVSINFSKISNSKEFFNCYGNSSLIKRNDNEITLATLKNKLVSTETQYTEQTNFKIVIISILALVIITLFILLLIIIILGNYFNDFGQ